MPAPPKSARAPGWLGACLAVCALLTAVPSWPQGAAPSREYQIKAVFLFNFTRFVDWPQAVFANAQTPMSICVLGEDPFGKDLDDVVQGETAQGHSLIVQRLHSVEEAASCHILYVSRSEAPRFDEIRAALNGKPVLSVSDAEGFIRSGGIVRFDTMSGKIRLSINPEAAKRAGLTVSSKLLRSVDIVSSD